jgi:hypothetical protein
MKIGIRGMKKHFLERGGVKIGRYKSKLAKI